MANNNAVIDDEENESLGDYLGHLLSSVTKARMQADLETIRIAEQYQSHPLLKHFPVPRVRLPQVELNIPVIMVGTLSPDGSAPTSSSNKRKTTDTTVLAKAILASFVELLVEVGGEDLSDAVKSKLLLDVKGIVSKLYADRGTTATVSRSRSSSKKEVLRSGRIPKLTNSLSALTDKSSTGARYIVKYMFANRLVKNQLNAQKLSPQILSTLRKAFLGEVTSLILNMKNAKASKIVIQAQTAKVRESSHQHLANFKLVVTEDSVEWTANSQAQDDDDDSNSDEILVPE